MKNKAAKPLKQIYTEALLCEMPERLFGLYPGNKELENDEFNHRLAKYYINTVN